MSIAASALLALSAQVSGAVPPAPTVFTLTCSLVGREGRARFTIAAGATGGHRRFAIRSEGDSRWIGQVTAASIRGSNDYHFVSDGAPYRLVLEFDPQSGPLTANAELAADRGFPALNVQLAKGSCRASPTPAGSIPSLPEAPEILAEAPPHRPVPLREGRVPSRCTMVLRDLSELSFILVATFDQAGIQLAVAPIAGQRWPTSAFTLRGPLLAGLAQPASGPPGGVMDVFAAADGASADSAPVRLQYNLHAEPHMIESWIQVRSASGGAAIIGTGSCVVGQNADRETGRQP
jgi:hypothetical protein